MVDTTGRELKVGQKVVTMMNGYTHKLIHAEVIEFTPQKVRLLMIDCISKQFYFLKFPEQLCIYEDI